VKKKSKNPHIFKLADTLHRWIFCKRKRIYGITVYYVSFEVHFIRRSCLLISRKS